jgi:hypothetical protein
MSKFINNEDELPNIGEVNDDFDPNDSPNQH